MSQIRHELTQNGPCERSSMVAPEVNHFEISMLILRARPPLPQKGDVPFVPSNVHGVDAGRQPITYDKNQRQPSFL
jgi:hypothetical protein